MRWSLIVSGCGSRYWSRGLAVDGGGQDIRRVSRRWPNQCSRKCSTGTTRWCRSSTSTSRASRRSWTWNWCRDTQTKLGRHRVCRLLSAYSRISGVRLANVERIALASRIDAAGVLGFNERDVAVVQSRAAGFVAEGVAACARVTGSRPAIHWSNFWCRSGRQPSRKLLAVRQSGDAQPARGGTRPTASARDRCRRDRAA